MTVDVMLRSNSYRRVKGVKNDFENRREVAFDYIIHCRIELYLKKITLNIHACSVIDDTS